MGQRITFLLFAFQAELREFTLILGKFGRPAGRILSKRSTLLQAKSVFPSQLNYVIAEYSVCAKRINLYPNPLLSDQKQVISTEHE